MCVRKLLVTLCKLVGCIVIFTMMTYAAGGCEDWDGLDCSGGFVQSFLDRVYFTTTTLTTVGYGDITPSTTTSRVCTGIFVLLGYAYIISSLSDRSNVKPDG